jgi:pimeloyl-ACP methyl ester carboxylesterase
MIQKQILPGLLVILALSVSNGACEEGKGHKAKALSYDEPLGIALETFAYPYPVKYFELILENRPVQMAYMDVPPSGRPRDETVVLLHGKNFFGAYFENVVSWLSKSGFRVVAPDQVGFGKSSHPDIHYSFDNLSEATIRLLDSLNVKEATILGHSMGGMLAVRLARLFPDRVNRLILENPIGLEDYRLKVPPVSLDKMYESELKQDTEKIRTFYRNYVVEWIPETYERYVEVRSRIKLSSEFSVWAKCSALTYRMIYEQPTVYELPFLKAPTLLVIGQKDRTTIGRNLVTPEVRATLGDYPRLGKEAAQKIPGAKLVEIPNSGHIPHLETPDAFFQALSDFLGAR